MYIILASISKFTRLTGDQDGRASSVDSQTAGARLVEKELDSTLVFNTIEVANANRWSQSSLMDDLIENSFAGLQMTKKQRHASREALITAPGLTSDPEATMTIHSNVQVTFHQRNLFVEMFGDVLTN